MKLSIIVPLFNEAENIPRLYAETTEALELADYSYELILVDDGSQDASYEKLAEIAASDKRVKVIRLRRNFGQTAAMSAGFEAARGEIILPMDGDLQNDPKDISRLAAKIAEGFDIVSGYREKRQDKFLTRRLPSILANLLISRMTGVHLRDYGCTLKAYRKEVLQKVSLYGELHRFVPALASQAGARVTEISVNHRARQAGVSKYGLDRTIRVILDLITVKFLLKYSTRPMQLFGKWGLMAFLTGGLTGVATLYMKSQGLAMNRNPLL
ncbi:MAG: glycosyltransferase family 2 protein, partial [Candidatus Marinimicrobia bacterium]|nr:glycosyltransferase family 2 protein [Candidatus Neomarinimicrobiota bacterium]